VAEQAAHGYRMSANIYNAYTINLENKDEKKVVIKTA
jgi:hypothetical protein